MLPFLMPELTQILQAIGSGDALVAGGEVNIVRTEPMEPNEGEVPPNIPGFQIGTRIAEGRMGAVYEAKQEYPPCG